MSQSRDLRHTSLSEEEGDIYTAPPQRQSRARFADNDSVDYELPSQPEYAARTDVPYTDDPFQRASREAESRALRMHLRENGTVDSMSLAAEARRVSAQSDGTLIDEHSGHDPMVSFASYQQPSELARPSSAHLPGAGAAASTPRRPFSRRSSSTEDREPVTRSTRLTHKTLPALKNSVMANFLHFTEHNGHGDDDEIYEEEEEAGHEHGRQPPTSRVQSRPHEHIPELKYNEGDSGWLSWFRGGEAPTTSVDYEKLNPEEQLDEFDPSLTGNKLKCLDDEEDVRKNALRRMNYKGRRKELTKAKIEFNITSIYNRQTFLLRLARALVTFGAPSHRVESQLTAAAKILEIRAEFIQLPNVIICSFGDEVSKTSETHFIKAEGGLALTNLHELHQVYRQVVHDEMSALTATKEIDKLLERGPLWPWLMRLVFAFLLSALICPIAFGGSLIDMWVAGGCAIILFLIQSQVARRALMYANVFEITTSIAISLLARGLSSLRSEIFCYTAISSAGIIGILPGYMILTSSLELSSKNLVCGSLKMVYALICTLFLGFGLQIGSDFYLVMDPGGRRQMQVMANNITTTISLSGSFIPDVADNVTQLMQGTWTFTNSTPPAEHHIIQGCYRPQGIEWYLSPFPLWTLFILVPIFSLLSSLNNGQNIHRVKELSAMVVISCLSFAANWFATRRIFNHSDIVSAIGAFTVGTLGNMWSRTAGGTAFTSMVTGVLFLVPSGLSQTGGLTANNGIDIGGGMIKVGIGITVGLLMSSSLVYLFGGRKNAGTFSF